MILGLGLPIKDPVIWMMSLRHTNSRYDASVFNVASSSRTTCQGNCSVATADGRGLAEHRTPNDSEEHGEAATI